MNSSADNLNVLHTIRKILMVSSKVEHVEINKIMEGSISMLLYGVCDIMTDLKYDGLDVSMFGKWQLSTKIVRMATLYANKKYTCPFLHKV